MRQVLQQGLLPCGGGRTVVADTRVYNKLVEVEWFLESERGRIGEEVLG